MRDVLPSQVAKYFWGDNLAELSLYRHEQYIAQTLLEKGDLDSIAWLFQHLSKPKIVKLLPTLKLSQKSANFWQIYLS